MTSRKMIYVIIIVAVLLMTFLATQFYSVKGQEDSQGPVKQLTVQNGDVVTTCIDPRISPDMDSYVDFSQLNSASLDAVEEISKTGRFDFAKHPGRIPGVYGTSAAERACKAALPKNATEYFLSGYGNPAYASYSIWAVDDKVVQIDGFYRKVQSSR